MTKLQGRKLWIQEGPGCLLLIHYIGELATTLLKKRNDIYIKFILVQVKGSMFIYAYDKAKMFEAGNQIVENEKKDAQYTQKLIQRWEKDAKTYYQTCQEMDKTDLSELDDKTLYKLYQKFIHDYKREYTLPMLTDMIGHYAEVKLGEFLRECLKKINKENEFNKILTILAQPVAPGFIEDEQHELLQITQQYINGKNVEKEMKKHREKWDWMQNNYLQIFSLSEEYFVNRVDEYAKEPKKVREELSNYPKKFLAMKREKQKIIQEFNLSKEIQLIAYLIETHIHWQDQRKKANLVAHKYIIRFLSEIGKRKNIQVKDLLASTPKEILHIMKTGEINLAEIKLRQKSTGVIFQPNKITHYDYKESLELEKEIQEQITITNVDTLYGHVATEGVVSGKVKNIQVPEDFSKMNKGDILVTSMTRPEFIPILKKASAIITDEGGLTCHAAIVARELDIPCIVSTKIATKILKDNDMVEVNANHGFVKIIK